MTIDTIIFDVGGVLTEENGRKGLFAQYGLHHPPNEKAAWHRYKVNEYNEEDYWRETLCGTSCEGREDEFARDVRRCFATMPASATATLVPHLKEAGYQLAILSNHVTEWVRPFLAHNHLEQYFNPILISSEIRLAKPDPRIAQYTLQAVGHLHNPCACVFIDDKQENIDVMCAAGLHGIRYVDYASLVEQLGHLGIR